MSVLSVQNLQETLVGKNIPRTNTTNPTAIADGEIVLVNSSGTVYATADSYATSPWVQLVQRTGNDFIWSTKIYGNRLTAVTEKANSAGQEQVYHIGYDGVTATKALDVNSGLDFMLTIIENQDDMMWSEQKKKSVVFVPDPLAPTPLDLAKAIVKNQMKKYMIDGSSITACMLNSGAAGAVDAAARTVSVVHGSNLIVYSGGTANVTVGSLIRIGTTTGGASGRVTTLPVYTVAAAGPVANSFYLDQPYAGPTQTVSDADHGVVTTPSTSYGVRFTGKTLPFRRDFFKFKRVSFTLQMSGFGTTPLTKTQDALYGNGDGRLVLEEESFSKGFEGALNRMTVPLPLANETFTADGTTSTVTNTTYGDVFVTPSTLYNTVAISLFSQDQATVVAVPTMPQLVKIFLPNGAAQGNTNNTALCLENQLNDWFASLPGQPFGATPVTVF